MMQRKPIRKTAVCLTALTCLVALCVLMAQADQQTRPQQTSPRVTNAGPNPKVQFGQYPPDFNLPVLTFGTDAAGVKVGKIDPKNTIRLSDYRGKKPVCLIMSSYT
ncbi:MAG: hypothetical protein GY869_32845 [Planctomycetes bacterium]|nr:hypothetical protein [Planctomycetota bacterium]